MNDTFSSLEDFDQILSDEYDKIAGYFPDKPISFVQRRFATYCIFPDPGWPLIGVGETLALTSKNPAILYEMLARFIKCTHASWGHPDERGLHGDGFDFCTLVVSSLYSALLGRSYISSVFHCDRKLSVKGYGAYKHSANLMICLECASWNFKDKAITQALAFVSAKSISKIDKAFVEFFLGVLANDRAKVMDSLTTFSNGYLKSDWGKYKAYTKPTFIQALITYAGLYMADPITTEERKSFISIDRYELWQEYQNHLSQLERHPHQFTGQLSFLNDFTFD